MKEPEQLGSAFLISAASLSALVDEAGTASDRKEWMRSALTLLTHLYSVSLQLHDATLIPDSEESPDGIEEISLSADEADRARAERNVSQLLKEEEFYLMPFDPTAGIEENEKLCVGRLSEDCGEVLFYTQAIARFSSRFQSRVQSVVRQAILATPFGVIWGGKIARMLYVLHERLRSSIG